SVFIWDRIAEIEERPSCGLKQLYSQAFRSDFDLNMVFQAVKVRHLPHGFFNFVLQLRHVVARDYYLRAWSGGACTLFPGCPGGGPEVSGNGLTDGFAGIQQPEHDEESHHGGDEISVGDLPRAAM